MDKIILYGLSDDEMDAIRHCGLKCELLEFDYYTDVISHYAELTILNPTELGEEEKLCMADFFKEIDPVDERVILTAQDAAFDGISFVKAIPHLFDDSESLQVNLLRNLKESKRDVDFSRRIMLAIRILHIISLNPGITTRQIAEKAEGVSDRSIKRYIRSLQAAGILIEYQNRGWVCLMDPREML